MKKNPRGGYVVEGLGAAAKDVSKDELKFVYGSSTQCPEGECGHQLTERHWHPVLKQPKAKRRRSAS